MKRNIEGEKIEEEEEVEEADEQKKKTHNLC
jgi:hypothetical protein